MFYVNVQVNEVCFKNLSILGQPDNDGGLEHYISASSRGWNDLPETRELTAYICEKGKITAISALTFLQRNI